MSPSEGRTGVESSENRPKSLADPVRKRKTSSLLGILSLIPSSKESFSTELGGIRHSGIHRDFLQPPTPAFTDWLLGPRCVRTVLHTVGRLKRDCLLLPGYLKEQERGRALMQVRLVPQEELGEDRHGNRYCLGCGETIPQPV